MRARRLALCAALLLLPASRGYAQDEGPGKAAGPRESAEEEEPAPAAKTEAPDEAEEEGDGEVDATSFTRDGWYVAVQGVYALENWDNPGGSAVENDWGVNGRLGYRFLEYWGLEFEYERVLQFRVDAGPSRPDLLADANVYSLNAKGFLPFGRVHPFLVAGIGLHQSDINDRGIPLGPLGGGEKGTFASRLGGGAELYLTPNLVWLTEITYVLPWLRQDNNDMQYFSFGFGVEWRFAPTKY
jgi:opacity protein-like surface antigen